MGPCRHCGEGRITHTGAGFCRATAPTSFSEVSDPRDAEIELLKAEVARVTEVARLLVGECEEQRECPVCGTDTNVEVCRPSCYVAKMRKVLDDKKGGG